MEISAQLARDSWSLGFGGTYPRFMGISAPSYSGIKNFGGYITVQRNFSEHVGVRLLGGIYKLESKYGNEQTQKLNIISGNADMLYYFIPCEVISPYALLGFGSIYFTSKNSPQPVLNDSFLEYQMNFGFGAEWGIDDDWKIKTELVYHTPSSNKLDGRDNQGEDKGLFGGSGDSYMTFDLGVQFYFSKGEASKLCDLYSGITAEVPDYPTIDAIEGVVKKYIPQEIVKEVVVEKPIAPEEKPWILVGVNFEFNKAKLLPESYPILLNALDVLNSHPEMKVEIQGHTDSLGPDEFNMKLSEKRAQIVKDYLVSKGINPDRLFVKGFGKAKPVADNDTAEGRALNRRIEFKVLK